MQKRLNKFSSCLPEVLEPRRLFSATTPVLHGITGEYFSGDNFQTAAVVRTDSRINFHWLRARPDSALTKGAFSVQWAGTVTAPTSGDYTFYTVADSGTQLVVNGTTLINNLAARSASTQSGTIALVAGQAVQVQAEYSSRGEGAAYIKLQWATAGGAKQVIPTTALLPAAGIALPPNQPLVGNYYTGYNFNQAILTRTDSQINFDFGTGVPDGAIPENAPFSVQWIGQITPPVTGKYSFETITDDGVRLFINGQKIIGDWRVHSAQADYGSMTLQAGVSYNLSMQYFQDGVGHGSAKLLWAQAGHVERFVKFTAPVVLAAPLDVTAQAFSTSQINLTWADVPNETGFTVERSIDGGATFTVDGTTAQGVTTFSDTGLPPSTPYVYEIIATNATSTSPASAPASATTLAIISPVVASVTASGTTATISWNTSSGATMYVVQRSLNGTSGWSNVGTSTTTSLQDAGLSSGTEYFYQVIASNSVVSSSPSNVVNVTTVPAAPTLTATAASDSLINLSWNDVAGETGFVVQQSANGSTGWTQTGTTAAGTTTLAVAGLTGSTAYHFRVIAIDAGGTSVPSNVASATTTAAPPSFASLTTLYGIAGSGTVYSINTTTGVPTSIGTLSFGTEAAGRDPVSGQLYYVTSSANTVDVSAWNPVDNSNHVINASVALDGPVAVAAFRDDGTFFVISGVGDLYAINRVTGDATLKGTLKVGGSALAVNSGDIAFGPDNTMYLCTNGNLYNISAAAITGATGSGSSIAATLVDSTGLGNLQIAFGEDGTLYGTSASGQLYSGQSTSSPATLVGSPSGLDYGDLASVPLNADLSVAQTASAFTHGGTGTYSITATNGGPDATVGPVQVIDTLAAGISFVAGSGTGWTYSVNGSVVTLTYSGNVSAGSSTPVATLTVQIASSATSPVVNTLTIGTNIFDPEVSNDGSSLSTAVS